MTIFLRKYSHIFREIFDKGSANEVEGQVKEEWKHALQAPQRPIFGILLKTQFLDRDTETEL